MADGMEPTEEYDSRITVRLLNDHTDTEIIWCSSFRKAIDTVKERQHSVTAAKIIDQDGKVVYTSTDTDIETWESVWQNEKRSLGVNVEEHNCPYDSVSCFADDLCVQCKMDKLQGE